MISAIRIRDLISFLVLGAMVVFSVVQLTALTGGKPPTHRANLSMEVSDISGLAVGSNVLLRGVPVGKISNIGATIHAATIDFYVDDRYKIPVDSDARLENLSALGETYINLVPRRDGGPTLQDGQRISSERTVQPASITELAASVVRVLNQLEPRALERIIDEGGAALPDPAATLPNISHASILLRNTAADMHGSGRDLLDNFQTLFQNASWAGPVLSGLASNLLATEVLWQDITKHAPSLTHGNGGIKIIGDLAHLLSYRLQGFLDRSAPDLKVLGEALRPKLIDIAGALMNLDTGQLLDNVLAAVPSDGTVTLHLVP